MLIRVLGVIVVDGGVAASQSLFAEQQLLDIQACEVIRAFGHLDRIAEVGLSDGVGQRAAGRFAVVAVALIDTFLRDVASSCHVIVRKGGRDAGNRRNGKQLDSASGSHVTQQDSAPFAYFNTTVLFPLRSTLRSACHCSARFSTMLSSSPPITVRLSAESV